MEVFDEHDLGLLPAGLVEEDGAGIGGGSEPERWNRESGAACDTLRSGIVDADSGPALT